MSFEHDIMISDAWRDNQPPPLSTQEGWVSGIQEVLEYWLKQVMPRPPKIWRDKNRMPGNKVFAEELDAVVANSAILLAILSEPYLASEWCARERDNFIKAANEQGGLEVNNDYRIFKINKLPVDRKALPQELNIVTGFDFYEMDAETRSPSPIDPTFGESEKQRFFRKVYDVSVALARLLKQMEAEGIKPDDEDDDAATSVKVVPDEKTKTPEVPAKNATTPAGGLTVYIPHTTRDLREVRDELVSELLRRNCKVLPEQQFTFEDVETFRSTVMEDLQKSDISIHLIGSRYGTIIEGETRSVNELQNEWAAAESGKRNLRRLIWIPKDLGEVTGQQATFLNNLRSDRNALQGADLLEDSVENLKSIVLEMLRPKPKAQVDTTPTDECKLYILHDESDKDAVRELRKALKDLKAGSQPLKLLLPVFDGDAASLREIHRQRFMECDAVLLYWGGSSQAWVDSCLNEIRKAPGFGRTQPFKAKHLVYLAGTKTSAKEDWLLDFQDGLLEPDLHTLDCFSAPHVDSLRSFISTIQ